MYFEEFIGYKTGYEIRMFISNIRDHAFHMHNTSIEIIVVLDGSVEISDSAVHHTLIPGDVYIFNPMEGHKLLSDQDNMVLTLQINQQHYIKLFPELIDTYFLCDSYKHKEKNSADLYHLRFLVSKLYFEYIRSEKGSGLLEEVTRDILKLLIDSFSNFFFIINYSGMYEMAKNPASDDKKERTYRIVNYIYDHCKENLKLMDLAKIEYMNPEYLSRYLKKNVGLKFNDILSIARCEEAERLLGKTDNTIDFIASESGFSNRQHLCKEFKKWFHQTPSAFRKSIYADAGGAYEIVERPVDLDLAEKALKKFLE